MLARNFKTAEQLDIDVDLYKALLHVLGMLERGELKHVPIVRYNASHAEPKGFNMNHVFERLGKCGTVGCIGGWAAHFMGLESCTNLGGLNSLLARANTVKAVRALNNLFYPDARYVEYGDITIEKAARSLSAYLTTGKAKW